MSGKSQVNVSLKQEQKERWDQAVEEDPRFATMSDLVRMSVEREISNNDRQGQQAGKEIAALSEEIDGLKNAFTGLSSDIQELKGMVRNQQPNNQNLRSEVFAGLPTGESATPASPEEIATKIGGPVTTDAVEEVLTNLAQSTGQVESHIGPEEGDIRYRKRGNR